MNVIHVVPHKDIKEHNLDRWCLCNPKLKKGVLVHNSFDERERIEDQLLEIGLNSGGWDIIE